MWYCKLCRVSFTVESVEKHLLTNHIIIKPEVAGSSSNLEVYNCGQCMFTATGGFEEIALHCINVGHEPSRVIKGVNFDEYYSAQLLSALQEAVVVVVKGGQEDQRFQIHKKSPSSRQNDTFDLFSPFNDDTKDTTSLSSTGSTFKAETELKFTAVVENEIEPPKPSRVNEGVLPQFETIEILQTPSVGLKLSPVSPTLSYSPWEAARAEGKRPAEEREDLYYYHCDTCEKAFLKSKSLTRHQRLHTGEKPFTCSTCGKKFRQKEHLNVHKCVHTEEKSYGCQICSKAFTQSRSLVRHLRVHSGERPYPCVTCGKSFVESGKLTIHQRIHTGERPYPCQVCGKSFARSDAMKSHWIAFHRKLLE